MSALAKILTALALLAALFGAEQYVEHLGYTRAQAEATVALDRLKLDAAATLATETAKVVAYQNAVQSLTNALDLKDADHVKTVNTLQTRLRAAADPAGRLRDPNAPGCGGGGGGVAVGGSGASGDRGADPAQAGGLLSVQLSELLQDRLTEADQINLAYASCRARLVAQQALAENMRVNP